MTKLHRMSGQYLRADSIESVYDTIDIDSAGKYYYTVMSARTGDIHHSLSFNTITNAVDDRDDLLDKINGSETV